jgi:peroxiredoxin family protein
MSESVAVILTTDRAQVVRSVLDLLDAAVAMEMETHAYFTGDAVTFVGRPGGQGSDAAGDDVRAEVAERLRSIKEEGSLQVYACTRAMKAHDIARADLAGEVDMPAGFAYFLGIADEAKLTLAF